MNSKVEYKNLTSIKHINGHYLKLNNIWSTPQFFNDKQAHFNHSRVFLRNLEINIVNVKQLFN